MSWCVKSLSLHVIPGLNTAKAYEKNINYTIKSIRLITTRDFQFDLMWCKDLTQTRET